MAAIDRVDLGIELNELGIAGAPPIERPVRKSHPALVKAPPVVEAVPAPWEVTAPQQLVISQFSGVIWRGFKTTAPLIAADAFALAVTGMLAQGALRFLVPHAHQVLLPIGVVILLFTIVAYWLCGLYSALGVNPVLELRQLIQINSIGFVAAAAGGMLAQPLPFWCLICWVIAVAFVPFCRATARRWCCRTSWWGHPTLVIASGKSPDATVLALLRAPTSGFRPVAVTDPDGDCRSALIPAINDWDELANLVKKRTIRYAVVSAPDPQSTSLCAIFNKYTPLIPHLVVLSDTSDLPSIWGSSRSAGRMAGMEMRNGRMLAQLWIVKRMIDVVVSAAALLFGFPLIAAIACAVKLTSRGPVFYGHSRIGYGGHWFMAWKFRTMHPNSEAVLRDYLATHPEAKEEWDRDHKLKNDPRVTRIGKFLRRTSLDEIPQVWNVLRGEMSLVGPRPIVASEVCKYGNVFRKYSAVKPGVTGMWQVSGRSEISYDERVRLDEYYIANWSPWLDLYILAKTVWVLARRSGAY